jgi:hypothetical protein
VVPAGRAYLGGSASRGLAKQLGQIWRGPYFSIVRPAGTGILAAGGCVVSNVLPAQCPVAGEFLTALELGHGRAAM